MWDAIIIGSGFGGALAARPLVLAGQRVLMLERGGWVSRGPENWSDAGTGLLTPHFDKETPYHVTARRRRYLDGAWHCVGGQSVFYGGATFRFRERDFEPDAEIVGDSGASWPFGYATLEPFYTEAERLFGVAGLTGVDPTEPWRSAAYPNPPVSLAPSAQRITDAALHLGLTPFRIPLAISYEEESGRACRRCGTCDGYACAAEAKNDVATGIIPALMRAGMTLRTNTVCVRLLRAGSRITGVEYVDRGTDQRGRATAHRVILAAGALATPHLLLASDLAVVSSAPRAVGRYLIRHRNGVVLGLFLQPPNDEPTFDKQVAIHDFYFGHPAISAPPGKLGGIQQLTPPAGLVRAYMPWLLRAPAAFVVSRCCGLLVMAEDQPQRDNGVSIDPRHPDRFGLPRLHVSHRHTARDELAAAALIAQAKRVLKAAGARLTFVHEIETFSHALGTVRMGTDPRTAPLDADGRFRGLDNLYVVDGSALPRSSGVNPSLTIAANALRIGTLLAEAPIQRSLKRAESHAAHVSAVRTLT